jgi:hypothetical protein
MHCKGLVRAAAFAALACAGLVRADEVGSSQRLVASDLSLGASQPKYLDEPTAPPPAPAAAPAATPDMPLMHLLDMVGLAAPLKAANINVGGEVEGSFTYSASSPPGNFITGRVFDFEQEDPTLNTLMVFFERTVDDAVSKGQFDIGARVELRYGGDSRLIHSLGLFDYNGVGEGPDNQFDLTQAYVDIAVPIGTGLKVRVGKFVTPIGWEVIDPAGNALYSHSFLFGYAIPFTQTGVTATYKISDALTMYGGVTRGWDTTLKDNNDTVDFMVGGTYTVDKDTAVIFNLISGADQPGDNDNWRTLLDVTLTHKIGDQLTIALNGDYAYERNSDATANRGDAKWWGVAGYATYTISPTVAVTTRGEYFNDDDGTRIAGAVGGAGVMEGTVGLAITPFPNDVYGKNLVIRPEVRYDYATKGFFDGGTDHGQFTAAIDAYYKF